MFYKTLAVAFGVSTVLIYLAFRLIEEKNNEVPCEDSCVRFCCKSEENCNFNISYLKEAEALNSDFKAVTGLECDEVDYNFTEWAFKEVILFFNESHDLDLLLLFKERSHQCQ